MEYVIVFKTLNGMQKEWHANVNNIMLNKKINVFNTVLLTPIVMELKLNKESVTATIIISGIQIPRLAN